MAWTDEDRARIGGVLRRSSDRVRCQRKRREAQQAARDFVTPIFRDIMHRNDSDLPTGAKDLVATAMLATLIKDD